VRYYEVMQNVGSGSGHAIRNILTPDFVRGFLAFFAFLTAFSAIVPTLPIFLARIGSNEREIGLLIGALGVSSLVSRFLVGGALTKYSEKSVMMFGALLFGLTFLAFIILRPFWPFFAVRILQGVAVACIDTAAFALCIKTIPLAYRGQGIGYLLLARSFALAIAPSLSVALINRYSFTILFLSCAGLSLCSLFLSWQVKGQEATATDKDTSGPGLGALFLEWKIVAPAAISFLQSFIWGALVTFFPLYAIQCGVMNPGHFFTAIAVMLIAGRVLGGRIVDTYSKEKILLTFIWTGMISMAMLSFSRTLPMFIVVGCLWGTAHSFFVPASMTYSLEHAGSSGGTAVGTFRALSDLGQALGPVIMGIIIPLTGYRAMFFCLALICLINLCYFQFYVRKRGSVSLTP
jgi:predicted MFS family arabinose efflux permease